MKKMHRTLLSKIISIRKAMTLPLAFTSVLPGLAHAAACPEFRKPQDVLDCVLKNHPGINLSLAEVEAAKKLRPIADLKLNPEFSNKTLTGLSQGSQLYAEFNLTQTIERGAKREARAKDADAQVSVQAAQSQLAKEAAYREAAISLYRLRQINGELRVIDDVIGTYKKIRKSLQKRPALTPDQKSSVRLFEISESAYELRKLPLRIEFDQISREIGYGLQQEFKPNDSVLPKRFSTWPSLQEAPEMQGVADAAMQSKKATIESAQAQIAVAQSEQSYDYRIGPSAEIMRQYDRNIPSFGFNVSIPIPFYHNNEAKTVYANESLKVAQMAYDVAMAESKKQRSFFVQKYLRHLDTIKSLPSYRSLSSKHDEIESFFLEGFIGSGPVLDIHQQLYEYAKTQDEIELSMIDALLRVKAFDGKQFEVNK